MPAGRVARLADLPEGARRVVDESRRAVLTTVDDDGTPHAVPVCFALREGEIVTAIDQKPKKGRTLKRVANVQRRSVATVLFDRWSEDWTRLGWVMARGRARVDPPGSAASELTADYPQYRGDPPQGEVIAVVPSEVLWWTWE